MKKILFSFAALLLSLPLFISCNLDGTGIYYQISQTSAIKDSELATSPANRILGLNTTTNTMFIRYGTQVRSAAIDAAAPDWTIEASNVSEAVYLDGNIIYSTPLAAGGKKDVKHKVLASGTITSLYSSKNVIDILSDGTFAYPVTSDINSTDSSKIDLTFYKISKDGTPITIGTETLTTGGTHPFSLSLAEDSGSILLFFLSVYNSSSEVYENYSIVSNGTTITSTTKLAGASYTAFNLLKGETDTGDDSPIVGAEIDSSDNVYLITRDGILIKKSAASYSAINNTDSSAYINVSNGTSRNYVPLQLATLDSKSALLIGGSNFSYYYLDDSKVPTEFTSDYDFYNDFDGVTILDLYDTDDSDFSFYASTLSKWVWSITDDATAVQLL